MATIAGARQFKTGSLIFQLWSRDSDRAAVDIIEQHHRREEEG